MTWKQMGLARVKACTGAEQEHLGREKRKNFFPLRVTEPWPRLPREAVESPSLEIFKTSWDAVLYNFL